MKLDYVNIDEKTRSIVTSLQQTTINKGSCKNNSNERRERDKWRAQDITAAVCFACFVVSPATVQHRKVLLRILRILDNRKQLLRLEVDHRRVAHHSSQPQSHYHQIQRQDIHRTDQLMHPVLVLDRLEPPD